MFVVTFYSYKGGVGRTLALVNVAVRLARWNKRVFLLDFDLEAPGIDEFRLGQEESRAGLLEYIAAFTDTGEVPPLKDYVFEASIPTSKEGRLFVMPAGRKTEKDYQVQLSRLDWKTFYRRQKGFLFVENLKAGIKKEFNCDYVLIDSRTGLTDISGICTIQLPNLAVLVFSLNNQNVSGISHVYQNIRSNPLGRQVDTLLVASPIPDVPDELGLKRERFDYARKNIGAPIDVIIPFDPLLAFKETLVVENSTAIAKAYDLLAKGIVKKNQTDVLTMLEEASGLVKQGTLDLAELRYQEMVETRPNDPSVWKEYGRLQKMKGNSRAALESFSKAHQLDPSNSDVLRQLALTNLERDNKHDARKYLEMFLGVTESAEEITPVAQYFENRGELQHAIKAYERAYVLSANPAHRFEIGNVYMRLAQPEKAITYFEQSAAELPTHLASVYNAGYALHLLGDDRAKAYFQRAIEIFEKVDVGLATPRDLANRLQAMSHAYLAFGKVERARQALERALATAGKISRTPIFSSVSYSYVPQHVFVTETQRLMRKLQAQPAERLRAE